MQKFYLCFLISNLWCTLSLAQHHLKLGTAIPLQYAAGYEYQFHQKISAEVQAGILTSPYDQVILHLSSALGLEEEIVSVIESAFQQGVVVSPALNYRFGKNYAGMLGHWISLTGKDTPTEAIENYFGEDINQDPEHHRARTTPEKALTLRSQLYQVGMLYGRIFAFANPNLEMRAEVSFTKNIGSQSSLQSDTRSLTRLSKILDTELKVLYNKYLWVPTVNLWLVYKLG